VQVDELTIHARSFGSTNLELQHPAKKDAIGAIAGWLRCETAEEGVRKVTIEISTFTSRSFFDKVNDL
jgi:hypothetical protein